MLNRQTLQEILAEELKTGSRSECIPRTVTSTLDYEKVAEFQAAYQIYNLNRKAEAPCVSEEQRVKAWVAFERIQIEQQEYNKYFRSSTALERAREIVHSVLPPFEFVEEDVWSRCTFGPGTFHGAVKSRLGSSTHYKIGGEQTVTAKAKALAIEVILKFFPNWAEHLKTTRLHTVKGNRPSHVPKDVAKCRPISIEPSLNVFLQQGVGRWLGQHMKEIGFADIHHGQAVNRRLAMDLQNATIDLSNASDTISRALVKFLLPKDWFEVLDTCRSKYYEYRGVEGEYENFSSQGNAFTFPLETLIFKAIVMAYTELSAKEVVVYGDDIIVPLPAATRAVYGLTRAGFTVNTEKSYWGQHDDERKYFRESCGADYYRGKLVTPVYLREDPSHDRDLAVLYNRLYEVYGDLPRTLEYVLSCCRKKPVIGPRYIIADRPQTGIHSCESLGLNSVVSLYDAYFWNVSWLASHPFTGKAYHQLSREIKSKDWLNHRTAELTFILKGGNHEPGTGRRKVVVRKAILTCLDDDSPLLVDGLRSRLTYASRLRVFL